jgi:hypothetical protein
MSMTGFDREVASIREKGVEPRCTRKVKQSCTPEEWAAFLEYRQGRRARMSEIQKRHYRKTHAAQRSYFARQRLWNRYAISPEQHAAMLAGTKGVCAICGQPPEGKFGLHVDHHHGDGIVRGMLCRGCNCGIGHFKDAPELLRKAADYLDNGGDGSFCFVTYTKLMEERHGNN